MWNSTRERRRNMFQIDPMSRQPVYEQIIDQTERLILTGLLKEGEQIPSVRNLSIELSINPNTVQKAYAELDLRGVIHSVPGKGRFVCDKAVEVLHQYKRGRLKELSVLLSELALAGITRDEIVECVDGVYHEKMC